MGHYAQLPIFSQFVYPYIERNLDGLTILYKHQREFSS